jgi:formyl-CoA transferase
MLADYGADVIKIEKPVTGDDGRAFPPKMDGVSIIFSHINRGKKSVVLDMKDPRAVAIVKKMIAEADVLVESNRPGVMKRLGLDYESVKRIKPDIIYCSLSAFGSTGPYAEKPGYDVIAQAFSGFMHLTGDRMDRP